MTGLPGATHGMMKSNLTHQSTQWSNDWNEAKGRITEHWNKTGKTSSLLKCSAANSPWWDEFLNLILDGHDQKCTCMPAVIKYSSMRILSIYLVYSSFFQNTQFIDGNGSVNIMIKVSCVMPYICIMFKRNNATQEGRYCHRTVLFLVIRQYCSAEVKIFVVSFTFATQID